MEDVSEFFKSGFLGLYKSTTGKNFHQKTLSDRVNNFNSLRRETRSTLIFQKRQIDENMTPISTPESSRIIKQADETKNIKPSNKRLEMLKKWKMEKEKRKNEQKQKTKPLFKVCHVPVEVGLPNLENVNKKIKGKPIKANVSHSRSQFAPPNHTFHAPKAIKPIHMESVNNNVSSLKTDPFKIDPISNSLAKGKHSAKVPYKERIVSERNTRATSRKEHLEKFNMVENNKSSDSTIDTNKKKIKSNSKQKTTNFRIKNKNVNSKARETTMQGIKMESSSISNTSISNTKAKPSPGKKRKNDLVVTKKQFINLRSVSDSVNNKVKIVENSKGKSLSNTKNISNKNKFTKLNRKETLKQKSELNTSLNLHREPFVKTVGWNCIEVIGEDSSVNVNIKTPKTVKTIYSKTPRKGSKLNMSDVELIDECDMAEIKASKPQSVPKVKRRLRKTNSNHELKELNQLEQIESDTKSENLSIGSAAGSASPDYPVDKNLTELNNILHTPQKSDICEDSPVYISPFVTVSRGKSSARKEYYVRQSTGELTPEFGVDILSNTSPKAGADYFLKKLNNEINRIEGICDVWESYKNSNELPEEADDMINVAIGQSNLLISKKFEQFRNLIERCRNCDNIEKPVSCEDLHGFWDMIYMQVEDLNKRFNNLNELKANNWQEIVPEKKIVVKRGRGRPKKASATTALKNLIKAARNMKKTNTEGETNLNVPHTDETKEFNGGYYSVKSPVRILNSPNLMNKSARRSLRVSLLTNQTKNRMSSSPGLTMMKISQAIKYGDSMTPSKSILKNDLTKSEKRIIKSVLFKDNIKEEMETKLVCETEERYDNGDMENDVDKENDVNEINLISFSPVTPIRRSTRLSKNK